MMKASCLSMFSRLEGHGSMVIVGKWDCCDDGITRPVVLARVPGADGISHTESFLVDTAADVTALSAELLRKLGLPGNGPLAGMSLQGIGGTSPHILVDTVLEFTRDDGGPARVQGKF